ncbi:MAG: AAA family ATPase, partial [Nanohaloarchaea archaeon]|nr:AAA family ATPase [Candidatus Nanohaloarchaea archaeon]
MALPISINKLMETNMIESERLELKEGFNPEKVLHTMCAFANDFNNWGGGYILLGVSDTRNVIGVDEKQIDSIMKQILNLSNKIYFPYFPIVEPVKYLDKMLIVLYCPGGPARPYKAPKRLGFKSEYKYYIRHSSSTVVANNQEEKELIGMSNQIPFDDQVNLKASIADLNIQLIKSYLKESGSTLDIDDLTFEELCKSLNIIDGPKKYLRSKNIGILMFSTDPKKYIKTPWIEVTVFYDEVGDNFEEETFDGDMLSQITRALQYVKNTVIKERVQKISGVAKARRFFTYPYDAIEEALVNAVYHKSYEIDAPIEIRVETDRIDIISYPGPLPPLNKDNMNDDVVISKRYRNRRIGDFLKEVQLTEGKNTGFRKIRTALKNNGSPEPDFITDSDRVQFITRIKIHPEFKEAKLGVRAGVQA